MNAIKWALRPEVSKTANEKMIAPGTYILHVTCRGSYGLDYDPWDSGPARNPVRRLVVYVGQRAFAWTWPKFRRTTHTGQIGQ